MLTINSWHTFTRIDDVAVPTSLVEEIQRPKIVFSIQLVVSCITGLIIAWMGIFIFSGNITFFAIIFIVSIVIGLLIIRNDPWIEISRIDGSVTIFNNSSRKKIVEKYNTGSFKFAVMNLTSDLRFPEWWYVVKSGKVRFSKSVFKLFSFGNDGSPSEREKYAHKMTEAILCFIQNLPYDKALISDCRDSLPLKKGFTQKIRTKRRK